MEALNKIFIRKLLKGSSEDVFYIIMADSLPTMPPQAAIRRCQVSLSSVMAHLQVQVSFQWVNVILGIVDLGVLRSCMAPHVSNQGLQKGLLFGVLHGNSINSGIV
jgi:hypothetical protein